jgi:hypothetical protein
MDRVDMLLAEYRRQVSLPWRQDLSGAERMWMAVYPPDLERKVRAKVAEFDFATRESGHGWAVHDVTASFSMWLAAQEYRDAYYADAEALAPALPQFLATLESEISATLSAPEITSQTVVALVGVGSLFPMIRVSDLLQAVANRVRGRLLVLFPGSIERGNYRLLDARDGWNYLAIPITIPEGVSR